MLELKYFYKLPSLVQLLVAEFMMTICLGGIAPYVYRAIWPQPLSYVPQPLEWSNALFAAIGVVLLLWLLWGPLFPRVVPVSWTPVFHTKNLHAIAILPRASVDYAFVTSHPSYVFVDAIVVAVWWFFHFVLSDSDPERLYEANCWLFVASIVPAWRLIAWYGLRRRPVAGPFEAAVREAWKPIAQLYVFFIAPLAIVLLIAFGVEAMNTRKTLAEMPTVEAATFNEQAFATLRDLDIKDKTVTRIVRLRATQISAKAIFCIDREQRPSVALLADFGPHGILIILNDRNYQDDRGLEKLAGRANSNAGKPIEAMGRLMRLPADREIPAWKRPFYCGLDRTEPRPKWVLEEAKP